MNLSYFIQATVFSCAKSHGCAALYLSIKYEYVSQRKKLSSFLNKWVIHLPCKSSNIMKYHSVYHFISILLSKIWRRFPQSRVNEQVDPTE